MAPQELDTRLLRYRTRPGSEDAARLATDLLAAERASDAIEITAAALRETPEDLALLVLDGRAHYVAGDLLRAQAALLKAARVAPGRTDPFRWLGEVLLKRGDPQRALKVLERARAIDANDRTILALHARAERLSRIADDDGADARGAEASAPAEIPGERTVVRPELSAQLARGAVHDSAADAGEEEPTSMMDRAMLSAARASIAPTEPQPSAPSAAPSPPRASAPPRAPAPPPASAASPASAPARASAPPRAPAPPEASVPPRASAPPSPIAPGRGEGPRPAAIARKATLPLGALVPAQRTPPARPPVDPTPGPIDPRPAAGAPAAPPAPARAPAAPPAPAARAPVAPHAPAARGPAPFAPAPPAPAAAIAPTPVPPVAPPARPPFASPPAPFGGLPAPPEPARAAPHDDEDVDVAFDAGPSDSSGSGPHEDVTLWDDALAPGGAPAPGDAPAPVPDVAAGEHAGQREDVDRILEMLQEQGIFEPPAGEAAVWAPRRESKVERTGVGVWMAGAWVLVIGAAAGGWFGWQEWVRRRHLEADRLVAQARDEARIGDHQRLVDAERHLRAARELDPNDGDNPSVLLFVHAQRALEDGSFDVGFLRPTIARGERMHADEHHLHAARAVLAAGEGDLDSARNAVQHALEGEGASDAAVLYVAGRVEQRLGDEHALEHLEAATQRDPELSAAAIALAESRHDEGRFEDAITLLDRVLAHDPQNLRAQLWKAFLGADDADPAAAMTALDTIAERLEHGAPTDLVLHQLTRARLLRRQGQSDPAGEAVEAALAAGAQEPRLLALMARAARSAGRLLQAEIAATAAVRGSPAHGDFRKLLASIYLDRRNGRGALTTLAQLPADDPDVLVMIARASLLVGTDEAITGAAGALDRYVTEHEDAGLEVRALRIRLGLEVGEPGPLLAAARELARENPGDPVASLALGEAALRAHEGETAVRALEQVAQASPDDADGHWLLGRARRMQGDGEGARASLERALALRPEHADARIALGSLLLDLGRYDEADALYVELARTSGSAAGMPLAAAGRLGRVEALVGLGRLDDAQVQLEGVRDPERQAPSARIAAAHLALARGRSGDAIREVRSLIPDGEDAPAPSPTVLALYADALLGAGEVEAAADTFDRALAIDAGLPEALIGRAELLIRAEHERDAAPLLARARAALTTRIRPPVLHARLLMLEGRVALRSRDDETARAKLREATAIPRVPPEAFFFLGESLAGENAPEARAAYLRYLELAPDGSLASRARRATAGR